MVALERAIDLFQERAGELQHFIIEAGGEAGSRLHLARADHAPRRAPNRGTSAEEPVDEQVLTFVNRLSDLLFSVRALRQHARGLAEEQWDATRTAAFSQLIARASPG